VPIITPDRMLVERNGPDHPCGASEVRWIGDPGGLTQFGAFEETLQPGSRSSLRHWHLAEDEMIHVLAGEVAVVEGDDVAVLKPGDAATFPAGVARGHFLENRSGEPCRYLVVGTRAETDVITYPDSGKRCVRVHALEEDLWIDTAGKPTTSPYRD
jgi:uncharacterized cupin superfamily protein